MFLDTLSTSVLRLCDAHALSYEAASGQCNLSSRYFGDIARGKTAPTIITLEKLCDGFDVTPNDLLIVPAVQKKQTFREPREVTHVRCYRGTHGIYAFPVCPRCGSALEREYQSFCDRCGQRLSWERFGEAEVIPTK